ncbi:hypothetical protein [Streptomyces sp. NPDC004721]
MGNRTVAHRDVATTAKSPSGRRSTHRTTRADMDAALGTRLAPQLRQIATALLDHAAAKGRLEGGNASYPSMSAYYPVAGRQVPNRTLSLYDNPPKEELAFSFGSVTHHLSPHRAAEFAQSLPTVAELEKNWRCSDTRATKAGPRSP